MKQKIRGKEVQKNNSEKKRNTDKKYNQRGSRQKRLDRKKLILVDREEKRREEKRRKETTLRVPIVFEVTCYLSPNEVVILVSGHGTSIIYINQMLFQKYLQMALVQTSWQLSIIISFRLLKIEMKEELRSEK